MQQNIKTGYIGIVVMISALAWMSNRAGAADASSAAGSVDGRRFDAMTELPAGEGKELTAVACTRCHDLAGLQAYQGYWNRAQWLAMVDSMVKNGAKLDAVQKNLVTDYLNNKFGRDSRK